jgi:hypothetical protein
MIARATIISFSSAHPSLPCQLKRKTPRHKSDLRRKKDPRSPILWFDARRRWSTTSTCGIFSPSDPNISTSCHYVFIWRSLLCGVLGAFVAVHSRLKPSSRYIPIVGHVARSYDCEVRKLERCARYRQRGVFAYASVAANVSPPSANLAHHSCKVTLWGTLPSSVTRQRRGTKVASGSVCLDGDPSRRVLYILQLVSVCTENFLATCLDASLSHLSRRFVPRLDHS